MPLVISFTQLAVAVGAIGGAITTLLLVVRPVLGMVKEWREFRGDWYGIAYRPGFPGHSGMGERMQGAETAIEGILGELRTNGGGSLRDEIRRIAEQQRISAAHAGAPVLTVTPNLQTAQEHQHQTGVAA